ncbi:hypothetical protein O0L34_g18635 [Tuta absoluta]|nr:hypothetical protein O0L34_g18635 [Tuta absoluta]
MDKTNLKALEGLINKCIAPYANEITKLTNVIKGLEAKIDTLIASKSNDISVSLRHQPLTNQPMIDEQQMAAAQQQPTAGTSAATSSAGSQLSARGLRAAARKQLSTASTSRIPQEQKTPPRAQNHQPKVTSPRKSTGKHTAPTLKLNDSIAILALSDPDNLTVENINSQQQNDTGGTQWTEVVNNRQKRACKTIIHGTGNTDDELQVVEKLKHIQAWSFKPETSALNVKNFLNKIS